MNESAPIPPAAEGGGLIEAVRALRRGGLAGGAFWPGYTGLASRLCGAQAAIVLAPDRERKWKTLGGFGPTDLAALLAREAESCAGRISARAMSAGFAFEPASAAVPGMAHPFLLASALDGEPAGAFLILLMEQPVPQALQDLVVRMRLIADIPAAVLSPRPSGFALPELPGHLLEILSTLLRQERFGPSAAFLVNELATRFQCQRVSLGWREAGATLRMAAISHVEQFEHNTDAVQRIEAAMEEACGQGNDLSWPEDAVQTGAITSAHQALAGAGNAGRILTLPLVENGELTGAITCERREQPFGAGERSALRLAANLLTPWLRRLRESDRWWGLRLWRSFVRRAEGVLGPEQALLKLTALFSCLALSVFFFGTWDYRVELGVTLTTDRFAFVAAPFDGHILDVLAKSGDTVRAGDELLSLDTRELLLRESEAAADKVRFSREAEKARAAREFADMRIAEARAEQARAALERVRYQLSLATLRAPISGVVVEGEKERLLGAPVGKGDLLFRIAEISDLYAKLDLDERDVREIAEGATGELALVSRPDLSIRLRVEKIIAVASVRPEKGNAFEVRALLLDPPGSWLRPGMSGVAKVDAGRRGIYWILTHRAVDWLRLRLWWW